MILAQLKSTCKGYNLACVKYSLHVGFLKVMENRGHKKGPNRKWRTEVTKGGTVETGEQR